jgi:uncharacterized protein (TIGR02145 family)
MRHFKIYLSLILIASLSVTINSCEESDITELSNPDADHTSDSPTLTSFTDPRDGQTYNVVQIGSQTWFAENLRFSGSVSEVSGTNNWAALYDFNGGNLLGQKAWCYYNDDPTNDAIYGKMYNWYAVNTGTLCPSGWHIPVNTEWIELTDFLGGENVAGGKMKATAFWNAPNTNASNSSGFYGLPGGRRGSTGYFSNKGNYGYYWSSSPGGVASTYAQGIAYNSQDAINSFVGKHSAVSCRCIQD